MGKFLNGLFIGIGVGLFIAPQTGEETRRLIMERVVALRKSMVSEDEQHVSIDAYQPQIPSLPAEPVQPATEFFSEPEGQGAPSISPASPIPSVTFTSEPEGQGAPNVSPASSIPSVTFTSEPEGQGASSISPASSIPTVTFASEPEEQGDIAVPPADALSTPSNQSTGVTGSNSAPTDTEQASDSTTNPVVVPDAKPDMRTRAETPRNDTAVTDKLPPVSGSSNISGRTAKKKPSTRTPNTGKSRGHSRP